ncbi:2-C-methyl-D-erythritol 2,4-cyclodiphosphate synthase [Treponema phagedenis]|uniref:2-C-methyl-D-erythritol 2,4-cyclodiphosphate synthase n=1 Tax=Treponema phagedenis TaxID=162 RepID=A0A0B7GRL2_TREPH|nr:2-C-methyl-D-erythritol 2,4-cyclodiphosphate synthase [Treponema phagedenis]NVP23574.1 2-C-methyl-D-erythritol 2,4-cyclodiphosphate synthase [Treponema phagedenis]QEJ94545.1 2-C-methyl-D-erythritol 2,4-cyclodiphosphate synthase [Treponema phagedenis]QEJ98708.1 2-C-methyl-D-erythritol 2,4-cyclodiphosphate synthase [Treponema phagedenis]QEK01577.1 2-C-methyl-D-erythritol 2,4-cyclodiphosphate synthase [Treponema phagedenis]QEK04214.1 2-C-methyl-D-erythritol 2,4-cyclodiphosphate synthase [Trepo
MIRIGLGYDLHVLEAGKKLLLGGVHIPFEKGEKAHSDGDVLLHAITDALLGAAALGDIGELFPPSDNKWKDADSKKLLQIAWQKILAEGWVIENIDCVIVIEKPKILPFRKKIIESIADILTIQSDCVFVKAKTAEGLGAIGASEAVAALVTALLKK